MANAEWSRRQALTFLGTAIATAVGKSYLPAVNSSQSPSSPDSQISAEQIPVPDSFGFKKIDFPPIPRIQDKTETVNFAADNLNPDSGAATYQTIENEVMQVKVLPLYNGVFGEEETVATSTGGKTRVGPAVALYNNERKIIYLDVSQNDPNSHVFRIAGVPTESESVSLFTNGNSIAVSEDEKFVNIGMIHQWQALDQSNSVQLDEINSGKSALQITTVQYDKETGQWMRQNRNETFMTNLDQAKITMVGDHCYFLDKTSPTQNIDQLGESNQGMVLRRVAVGNHVSYNDMNDWEPAIDFRVDRDKFAIKKPSGVWELMQWNNFGKNPIPLETNITEIEYIYDFERLGLDGVLIVGKDSQGKRIYTYGFGGLKNEEIFSVEMGQIRDEGVSNGVSPTLMDSSNDKDFLVIGIPQFDNTAIV